MKRHLRNLIRVIFIGFILCPGILTHIQYDWTNTGAFLDVTENHDGELFFKLFSFVWFAFWFIQGLIKGWFKFEVRRRAKFIELFHNAQLELDFYKKNHKDENDIFFPVTVKGNTATIKTGGKTEAFLNRIQDFSDATGLMFYRVGRAFDSNRGEINGIVKVNFTNRGLTKNVRFDDMPKVMHPNIVKGKTVDGWLISNINRERYTVTFGEQGSGKTSFSESQILQLYQRGLPLILMDFKNNERYGQLDGIPNIITTGDKWDAYHIFKVLERISAFRSLHISKQRKQHYYQCRPVDGTRIDYPIMLFIDELYEAVEGKDNASKALLRSFTRLVSKARSQGIFAHFITQYPDKGTLQGGFRPNISAYFGFRSEDAVMNMIFNKYKDLKIPAKMEGRFITDLNGGFERVQSAYLKEGELRNRMLNAGKTSWPVIRYLRKYVAKKQDENAGKVKKVEPLAI